MREELKVNSEKYKFRKFEGITLVSLVITIVILIILASVAIYLSLGNNGIFTRAKEAKEVANKQEATEIINLKITTAQMNKYAEKQEMLTLKELSLVLKEDSEIQYITEKSQIASAEYDVSSDNPTKIYTKLNKYPYEFEINDKLQLASINGVKIASDKGNTCGIYKLGTYQLVGASVGTAFLNRVINANTIDINVKEKYSNYEKLTENNFIAVDSFYKRTSYSINTSDMDFAIYSTQIQKYDSNSGILTIMKGGGAYDNVYDSYDCYVTGTVTIYIIEDANIKEL